jgi:hypothetical protein
VFGVLGHPLAAFLVITLDVSTKRRISEKVIKVEFTKNGTLPVLILTKLGCFQTVIK